MLQLLVKRVPKNNISGKASQKVRPVDKSSKPNDLSGYDSDNLQSSVSVYSDSIGTCSDFSVFVPYKETCTKQAGKRVRPNVWCSVCKIKVKDNGKSRHVGSLKHQRKLKERNTKTTPKSTEIRCQNCNLE